MATLLGRIAPGGLAYLPITFSGTTRLDPVCEGDGDTPADARVVSAYHTFLIEEQQQYINLQPLIEAARHYGALMLACGSSPWTIPPSAPLHDWMVDFLTAGSAPSLWAAGHPTWTSTRAP